MTEALDEEGNAAVKPSALSTFIDDYSPPPSPNSHQEHLRQLALQIFHNLAYQHHWTALQIHTLSTTRGLPLPRPIISGLPPRRLYIHPDEQIALLETELKRQTASKKTKQHQLPETDSIEMGEAAVLPEREWVLPTNLREKWSLNRFAEVFDGVGIVPPLGREGQPEETQLTNPWRTTKRMILATLQDDSTVVYYIVHDGIVKPRQN